MIWNAFLFKRLLLACNWSILPHTPTGREKKIINHPLLYMNKSVGSIGVFRKRNLILLREANVFYYRYPHLGCLSVFFSGRHLDKDQVILDKQVVKIPSNTSLICIALYNTRFQKGLQPLEATHIFRKSTP